MAEESTSKKNLGGSGVKVPTLNLTGKQCKYNHHSLLTKLSRILYSHGSRK